MKAIVIKGINRLSVDDIEVKKPQGDEVSTKVITNRFSIDEAQKAFDMGLKATSGKILIYPDASKMPR